MLIRVPSRAPAPRVNQMPKPHIGTGTENGDRSTLDFTKLLL